MQHCANAQCYVNKGCDSWDWKPLDSLQGRASKWRFLNNGKPTVSHGILTRGPAVRQVLEQVLALLDATSADGLI